MAFCLEKVKVIYTDATEMRLKKRFIFQASKSIYPRIPTMKWLHQCILLSDLVEISEMLEEAQCVLLSYNQIYLT